jgi:peptidoglycan L-alanyl-D-glutamate endopeptidase CwlK
MQPSEPRLSDPGLLVPAFRERVEATIKALRGQGYSVILFETLRSKLRAQQLVAAGKSKAKGGLSMHCYGIAADVICGRHQWDCRRHHCRFFEDYGLQAEDMGLIWGGRWTSLVDLPHVQAVPLKLQDRVRAMPEGELDAFVRGVLAGKAA